MSSRDGESIYRSRRDAGTLSNPEVEELVRDRQLNSYVLARWRKYLRESKASGEPVFRLWHAAAEIPDRTSPANGQRRRQRFAGTSWSVRKRVRAHAHPCATSPPYT